MTYEAIGDGKYKCWLDTGRKEWKDNNGVAEETPVLEYIGEFSLQELQEVKTNKEQEKTSIQQEYSSKCSILDSQIDGYDSLIESIQDYEESISN